MKIDVSFLFEELSSTASELTGVASKKFKMNNHVYFLACENGTPCFLIPVEDVDEKSVSGIQPNGLRVLFKNLKIDSETSARYLILSIRDIEFDTVFYKLIESILYDFECKSGDTLTLCILALKRWRAFFRDRTSKSLSLNQMIGLYGEMYFFKTIHNLTGSIPVKNWTGPLGKDHDFVFPNCHFEIKSSLDCYGKVSISSISQLEIERSKDLFIVCVSLARNKDKSQSLKELIYYIDEKITIDSDRELYWKKLVRVGYSLEQEDLYDDFSCSLELIQAYLVNDKFPRIIHSSFKEPLDFRVSDISYSLELKNLEGNLVSLDEKISLAVRD